MQLPASYRCKLLEGLAAIIFVGLVLGWHGCVASNLAQQQERLMPGEAPATATTGYRVFPDPDIYTWLTYAKEAKVSGAWRINHTLADNPPLGREAHWNSLSMWLLLAAGWVRQKFTGEQFYTALENGAFGVNAALFLCTAVVFYVIGRRLFGAVATWIGLVLLGSLGTMLWTFHPGRPDHQTLYFLAALGTVGCLLRGGFGWVKREGADDFLPDARQARRWFIASAWFGAAGMWFGASVQISVLAFIGLSMLGLIAFTPREEFRDDAEFLPELWRTWGIAGGLATVLFYLVQYAPGAMGMRLESIHPAHAVSWIGAGWLISLLARWRMDAGFGLLRRRAFYIACALVLVWPLATNLGPESWHILRDPLIVRFQTRTMEGMPLPMALGKQWLGKFLAEAALLPLLIVLVPAFAASHRMPRALWTSLLFLWISAMGYLLLTYWQGRWGMHWNMAAVLLGCFAWRLVPVLWSGRKQTVAFALLGTVMLGSAGWSIWRMGQDLYLQNNNRVIMPMMVDGLYVKRLAGLIRARHGEDDVAVIMEPTSAPALYYFSGIRSVGSLFWQNAEGLRAHRDFMVSTDRAEALEIVRARHVDYVMVWENSVSITFSLYLAFGEKIKDARGDFLVNTLVNGGPVVPSWLKEDYELMYAAGAPFADPLPWGVPQMRIYKVEDVGE